MMKILIADDDVVSRRLLERTLERAGYQVVAVTDGRQALDCLCGADGPRLALLDWIMPQINGPDVCRQVRGRHLHSYVHIILLSSNDSKQDVVAGLESGADDYLIKPFHSQELKARLRTGERILQLEDSLVEAQKAIKLQATRDLHAQKLEAVGGLAAGIAHEINTPIQFVGDNTRFLHESFRGMAQIIRAYEGIAERLAAGEPGQALLAQVAAEREKADWDYLRSEVPIALDQMMEGLGRVAQIVSAMKEFSHVDRNVEKSPADLNRALQSTLVVAGNELKYVADVETDYGEVPPVMCHLGDLNQVFLNLLVNAAHAIGDVVKGTDQKGRIKVQTRQEGESVEIAISDTGTGIPQNIQDKIFNPFFTTKEVGRGTGQGLALARAIVVEKHGGTLTFDTEPGEGTTFRVRLPLSGAQTSKESSKEAPQGAQHGETVAA